MSLSAGIITKSQDLETGERCQESPQLYPHPSLSSAASGPVPSAIRYTLVLKLCQVRRVRLPEALHSLQAPHWFLILVTADPLHDLGTDVTVIL